MRGVETDTDNVRADPTSIHPRNQKRNVPVLPREPHGTFLAPVQDMLAGIRLLHNGN
jgi:hypothetical protein